MGVQVFTVDVAIRRERSTNDKLHDLRFGDGTSEEFPFEEGAALIIDPFLWQAVWYINPSHNISEQWALVSKLEQLLFSILGANLGLIHLISLLVNPLERYLQYHCSNNGCEYHTCSHPIP